MHRMKILCAAACLSAALGMGAAVMAQDATPDPDVPLVTQNVGLSEQVDIYGRTIQVALGELVNASDVPYANIALEATVYDADDEIIGEGLGFLNDACGAGLLPNYLFTVGHIQDFSIPLELYEDDAFIDRVEIEVTGDRAGFTLPPAPLPDGITRISDQEVVTVEWQGADSLRYAIGCPRDLSAEWKYRQYNLQTDVDRALVNPYAPLINDELRTRLNLADPLIYDNSRLSFAPNGARLVFQDAVNRLYTAALDGRLQRQALGGMNSYSLQSIQWVNDSRFIATYFGAVGDPALYFTGNAEGIAISPPARNNRPSVILPGASSDARRVVIAGTFSTSAGQNLTGYYIHVVTNGFFELLFEAQPPGLNYPQPVPILDPEEDIVNLIYIARPVDGMPMLQCYDRDRDVLTDLAPLPLTLADGDRSGLFLSPDQSTLALTATGANGGLWTIDLAALPSCTG
jgi:hypothetical protein